MITNLSGNIYYQNGSTVWGPIEATSDKFLVHFSDAAHTSKFPKTEEGLRAAITDARECDVGNIEQVIKLDSGYICK